MKRVRVLRLKFISKRVIAPTGKKDWFKKRLAFVCRGNLTNSSLDSRRCPFLNSERPCSIIKTPCVESLRVPIQKSIPVLKASLEAEDVKGLRRCCQANLWLAWSMHGCVQIVYITNVGIFTQSNAIY